VLWDASRDFEEQPLQGMNGRYDGEGEHAAVVFAEGSVVGQESIDAAHALSTRSRIAVAFASVVWASTTYIVRPLTANLP
jgi:coenzyme F420-reducing hydrogenase gamma subunit